MHFRIEKNALFRCRELNQMHIFTETLLHFACLTPCELSIK